METTKHLPPLLILALLGSCGHGDPKDHVDSGYVALGSSDWGRARTEFDAAIGILGSDTAHPEYLRAQLGRVEATLRIDAEAAALAVVGLLESGTLPVGELTYLGRRFADVEAFDPALDILESGKERFPDSVEVDELADQIRGRATAAGNEAVLEALAGLGYVS